MKLPTLNTPVYTLKVPSTKKELSFRPYLVGEEKLLLIALESKDVKQIFAAMKRIVEICTFDKVDLNTLTSFDLEYIFLKLRVKAVGETATVTLKCAKDGYDCPVEINLDEIEIDNVIPKPIKVQLTDNIGITLAYPKLSTVERIEFGTDDSAVSRTDLMLALNAACIETIYTQNKVFKTADVEFSDVITFVNSLSRSQFKHVTDFFASIPILKKEVTYVCPKCGHENTQTISGLMSFFS
jgi:hypothetical protein